MDTFEIEGEYIQLIQLLKATGLCSSGGEAKMIVDEGMVIVNGEVELQRRKKIRPGDEVELEGQKVRVT
ncbi:MAG: RNA-binding S4 domain-containing protein [Flavobacteriales bacterium]|nr:RNA-binding S4 domain-containing protein [Flavobacteriales bacterium]